MISAVEARLRSEVAKEKLFDSELNDIQNEIEKAISEGKCYCYYYSKIMPLDIKQHLENLGYYVETHTQYNEIYYKISWRLKTVKETAEKVLAERESK